MQRFTDVMYDSEPETVSIWGKSVDVVTDKREVEVTEEDGTVVTKWQADVERYEPIEFARKTATEESDYALAGKILLGMEG